ncbi:MAG: hypothetical protein Q9213_005186 [Squamulea squamosa]
MAIEITCDSDLPKCLDTPSKQASRAKRLATLYFGIPAIKTRRPNPQGFFSRTIIVTLDEGQEAVIQFRPEPLDLEPFILAHTILGSAVPQVAIIEDEALAKETFSVHCITCIPGQTWLDSPRAKTKNALITKVRSLGRLLSRGAVGTAIDDTTELVIENQFRPHLNLLLASKDAQICLFHPEAKELIHKLDRLKSLPLFISHFDLNDVNIMVHDNCEVSGIVDWELSRPLPFGMGFCRIHTLAGEFSDQRFYMPPHFEDADRAFWYEIEHGIPDNVKRIFHDDPEVIQIAITLGTLLDAFQLDDGRVGPYNPVIVDALPKLLTYQFPVIRGSAAPYRD